MNGDSTGLEPADSGSTGDHGYGNAGHALRVIRAAKAIFEARGCWRLVREIEDETARWDSEEALRQRQLEVPLGGVDGENPEDARQEEVTARALAADSYAERQLRVDGDD